ncbi:hypothetical protein IWX88_002631 [Frigoribacterium sp. CG_9.8]|nr:hypothetical protein [Frigoribacterium sp. CG_9.8]
MAEYTVGDNVLWQRLGRTDEDDSEVVQLLSTGLRKDLKNWNSVFDMISATGFKFSSDEVELQHRIDAFLLSARVQRELGPSIEIWCAAGGGDNFFGAGGRHPVPGAWYPQILVRTAEAGTALFDWAPRAKSPVTAEQVHLRPSTATKLAEWRSQMLHATMPEQIGGLAHMEARAIGLEVTAEVQQDIGIGSNALFFGGGNPQAS